MSDDSYTCRISDICPPASAVMAAACTDIIIIIIIINIITHPYAPDSALQLAGCTHREVHGVGGGGGEEGIAKGAEADLEEALAGGARLDQHGRHRRRAHVQIPNRHVVKGDEVQQPEVQHQAVGRIQHLHHPPARES
jgi:hypothetical protein